MESLTGTLVERVSQLVQAAKVPRRWGSPLLSVTPTSIAIRELARQIEALERALQEIALEVQRLSAKGEALERLVGAAPPPRHTIR